METMLTPDLNYPFDDIKIKTPKALQGGTYCANLEINNGPILIQTPKCKTKNGIHKTAKQVYCDLILNDDHQDFLEWIDLFQEQVRKLILKNAENWFHDTPTLDDIEYNWNDSVRSRSQYDLLRTFIHKPKGINQMSLQIYDSDENKLNIDEVTPDKNVICILEFVGLKFSSNSFHLEIGLRQMMVINEKPLFNKCLIKLDSKKENGEKLIESKQLETENLENNDTEQIIVDTQEQEIETPKETENLENMDTLSNIVDTTEQEQEQEQEEIEENNDDNELEEHPATDNGVALKHLIESQKEEEAMKKKEEEVAKKLNEEQSISLEKTNDLEEIELNVQEEEPIKLKNPTEVYLDIYKAARNKAKNAKNEAIKAYFEVKRIKELYMLDVADSSSDDEEEEEELFSEN
jgi:hypothetical protein